VADRDRGDDEEVDRLSEFRIEPWGEDDQPLLERLLGDPAMTEHLGGPESPAKIADRHKRYLNAKPGAVEMFKVVDESGVGVGSVGYWERDDADEGKVFETGWAVLPEFQGRGIATTATAQVIAVLKAQQKHRYLYAFPSEDNHPSNAICRKLGFELVGLTEYEYPKDSGNIMRCNDWRLDLLD
jgi:RimJ/RimL family protein N-acetyltransferase